jgi:type IV secretory pathway VirB10-like protein
MSQKEEQGRTDIAVEETAAPAKRKIPHWWFFVIGGVLLLIAAGGLYRALSKSNASSHQPTTEQLQQLKYDSEQKDRETKKASQLRDQPFLVRNDDTQAQVSGFLKSLNSKKDAEPKPMDEAKAKSEEEAIAHVLKNSPPARTPSGTPAYETPRRSSPKTQGTAAPDAGSVGPMFIYSRDFGGAKYVDAPQKQAVQPAATAVGDSAKASKTAVEKPKPENPKEEKSQLIYTNYPPVTLYEGELLEAVLVNRIIADTESSPVICHLSRDLYDQSAKYVVLPANSRIIGSSQVVNYKGAHRLFVNFSRIILPNGPSIDLPSSQKALKALDETGALGVVSKVERHWFMQFGTSIFFGVLDGISGLAQRNQEANSTRAIVLGRTSENFGKILENIMSQYSTIVPTIRIDQGKTMRIYLADDIVISPYAKISDRSYYASH